MATTIPGPLPERDSADEAFGQSTHISLTVKYSPPDVVISSVEARQAFYDALRALARKDYEDLARVARAASSADPRIAMSAFSCAIDGFPTWFAERGLVPTPGFDASIFSLDAFESMGRQATDLQPFKLRAYRWGYKDDAPAVNIECWISHPMARPPLNGEPPAGPQVLSMTELRDSAVELFRVHLTNWLEAVYARAKETGVVSKEAKNIDRDMQRLVQKQVLGYSSAQILALENGTAPADLADVDYDANLPAVQAVRKSIRGAARRLGLTVIHPKPGPKTER